MNLAQAKEKCEYRIKEISSGNAELKAFLLSIGCFEGEKIFVVSKNFGGALLLVKGVKYNFDSRILSKIQVE